MNTSSNKNLKKFNEKMSILLNLLDYGRNNLQIDDSVD